LVEGDRRFEEHSVEDVDVVAEPQCQEQLEAVADLLVL
jgi:hypothetical protein